MVVVWLLLVALVVVEVLLGQQRDQLSLWLVGEHRVRFCTCTHTYITLDRDGLHILGHLAFGLCILVST